MFKFVELMSAWDQTFFYIAIAATLFFVGQIILTFIGGLDGGDIDVDSDGDGDHNDMGSFKILTLKNIVGFLMGIGWGGLALHLEAGLSKDMSLILAVFIGFAVMILQTTLFWLMFKLHAPNTETVHNAIGNTGTVYLAIPRSGVGKVTVEVNGKISTLNARSEKDTEITTNATVEVVGILNDELIVRELYDLNISADKISK